MMLSISAHLVEIAREGKISSTKHKSSPVYSDLYENEQLGLETLESLLQDYYFFVGPTQCQVSRESALMKIQQNQLLEESRFRGSSSSYVNHVEQSVNPDRLINLTVVFSII